jgi:hypothetical protein
MVMIRKRVTSQVSLRGQHWAERRRELPGTGYALRSPGAEVRADPETLPIRIPLGVMLANLFDRPGGG